MGGLGKRNGVTFCPYKCVITEIWTERKPWNHFISVQCYLWWLQARSLCYAAEYWEPGRMWYPWGGPHYSGANDSMDIIIVTTTTGCSGLSEHLESPTSQRPWVLPVREEGNARIFWSMDGVWSIGLKKLHVSSAFTVGTVGTRDRSPRRKVCWICFKMFCMALNLQKWSCVKPRAKWATVQTDRDLILWKCTKGQPVGLFNSSP